MSSLGVKEITKHILFRCQLPLLTVIKWGLIFGVPLATEDHIEVCLFSGSGCRHFFSHLEGSVLNSHLSSLVDQMIEWRSPLLPSFSSGTGFGNTVSISSGRLL
ncbi:hypothetical protein AVEN_83988-1 [Araneus ventricosus]|uniref:Uncharacterized protein n=1 Tax=Araneus ventricosus TaxID=182803 RepID=A0A4Y2BU81_ARAVE|nr:hypothetical protein AVEN_83988-1 [Araneus ventricosus]